MTLLFAETEASVPTEVSLTSRAFLPLNVNAKARFPDIYVKNVNIRNKKNPPN
jgi:hypothetical protein